MIETIFVKETLLKLKALESGLVAAIDKQSALRLIDPKKMTIVDGFKSKLVHEHVIPNIVDISIDGKFTLIGVPKRGYAALFLTQEKKLLAKVGDHKGYIEAVAISDDNHYIATGGTDGRTYIYHTSTGAMIVALAPHSDYVTAIAFHPHSTHIATGSFDRTIKIKNIALMSETITLRGHQSVVRKIVFLSSDTLLSVEKEGEIFIWDLNTQKIKHRLPKLNNNILDVTISADRRFLFASTPVGSIAFYDLTHYELVTHKYIQGFGPVNAMALVDATHVLLYANKDGEINQHYLLEGEEALEDCVLKGAYHFAYNLVHDNPLLAFSHHYEALENRWERAQAEAKILLMTNKKEEALICLEPFSRVPKKSSIVQKLLKEYVEFGKFVTYIEQEKYALAYSVAAKYPLYKESKEYDALEAIWEKRFAQAKKVILENGADEGVREVLAPFRGVSEKAKLISELYNHRNAYIFFRKKLAQKDFVSLFALIKQFPYLKELKEYKDLMVWADHVYIKLQHHVQHAEYIEALKLAPSIKEFPDFKDEISTLMHQAHIHMQFDQALKSMDKSEIYKLLERHPFLQNEPKVQSLDPEWNQTVAKAEPYIAQGNIKAILELFKEYFTIAYKKEYLLTILKMTYMRQIERAIKQGTPPERIINGFKTLYVMFGEDDVVEQAAMDYAQKMGLTISFDHLIPSKLDLLDAHMFAEDILHQ